ncbi:MAG: membrane protein insertase YidC [Firmicutes bacterium]|nr:membrane protein insertase YidC [Bacillota bacterium]
MINALAGYINIILTFFYELVNNYGLAIIMLTAVVNIITLPLTRKQLQASKKMQEIQPELKKIQEKYKHDKEKLNQVTMDFMRENKVNPLGGCLPLLIQFPILIAVFQLLREPELITKTTTDFSPFFLFWDLTKSDPYYVLPILAAVATFFQQLLVITDPKQKMMLYIFPVIILVISVSFPAGLVLYWFTNSIFSIGNHLLMKKSNNQKVELSSEKIAKEKEEEVQAIDKRAERQAGKKGKTKKVKAKMHDKSPKKKISKAKKKGAGKNK